MPHCDVGTSGKGLIAAMYSALVMGTIHGIHKTSEDAPTLLQLLNKQLRVRPVSGRYSSTIYALFDPASRELTLLNAGVPLPLLVSVLKVPMDAGGCAIEGPAKASMAADSMSCAAAIGIR